MWRVVMFDALPSMMVIASLTWTLAETTCFQRGPCRASRGTSVKFGLSSQGSLTRSLMPSPGALTVSKSSKTS